MLLGAERCFAQRGKSVLAPCPRDFIYKNSGKCRFSKKIKKISKKKRTKIAPRKILSVDLKGAFDKVSHLLVETVWKKLGLPWGHYLTAHLREATQK